MTGTNEVMDQWKTTPAFKNLLAGHYPLDRPPRETPAPERSRHVVHADRPKQVIRGIGFEIMSDSIGSANIGLPDEPTGVPHDLVPAERTRLYEEMLSGFRYCRLAGGLYWRGLDAEEKVLRPRWPEQLDELREMMEKSGVEGVSLEYWSPPPFWKGNRAYIGNGHPKNRLRCFLDDFDEDPDYHGDVDRFLADFADAQIEDLRTLRDAGIAVSMWNMQEEPFGDSTFPLCPYRPEDYKRAFTVVAARVRAYDPGIQIIADTNSWWDFPHVRPVLEDPEHAHLVDALAIHLIGYDSKHIDPPEEPSGKPRFNNEFEYLWGPATAPRCLNTVQNIMNWFQLADAPTWFWLHALKPYTNEEASGYSLGYWRPSTDERPEGPPRTLPPSGWSREPNDPYALEPGHWCWNKYNWYAVGAFVRRVPWDSRSLAVTETDGRHDDLRILAFHRPDGKLSVVLSNRSGAPHTFEVDTGPGDRTFAGFRYTPESAGERCAGVPVGRMRGGVISPVLPDMSWEFWEEI